MKTIRQLCDIVRQTAYEIPVYLKGTGIEHGLLINFGSFGFQIRKFVFGNVQVVKETSSRFVSLLPFCSAFLAFFRG